MDAVQIVQGTAVPLDRSDVDTDQIIPAEWLKRWSAPASARACSRLARRPRLRAQRRALRRRQHPDRRSQLRHRVEPRARRVGDHGLRLPGRDQPPVRRHLPQQLHEERPRAGRRPPEVARAAAPSGRGRPHPELVVDVDRRTLSAAAIGLEVDFPLEDSVRERFLEGLDDIGITLRTEGPSPPSRRRAGPSAPAAWSPAGTARSGSRVLVEPGWNRSSSGSPLTSSASAMKSSVEAVLSRCSSIHRGRISKKASSPTCSRSAWSVIPPRM